MLTLIENAEVFGPEPLGSKNLLIGGGQILAVDAGLDPIGLPLVRVDGSGMLLVPGFVDSLVHISGGGGEGGFTSRTRPLQARDALRAGVTTVIGALGTDDVTRSHADLLACAYALREQGLAAWVLSGSYHLPLRTVTGSLRDDLVLIEAVIGVGEIAIADHRGSQPNAAELARVAAEAGVAGLLAGKRGTVLVHLGDQPEGLALLWQCRRQYRIHPSRWLPTHMNRQRALLDQAADWLAAGGAVDLTASTTEAMLSDGEVDAGLALAELLALPQGAGRITISSDGQASLPQFDAEGRLTSIGVATMDSLLAAVQRAVLGHRVPLPLALDAVTATPARLWGLAGKGRIAVGADADLLLLDRDTLAVRQVYSAGQARL